MKLYKILDAEGRSCNGGKVSWSLPIKGAEGKWKPGEWMPKIEGTLELCKNGYHLCRPQDLLHWLGAAIYEAEYGGEMVEGKDKIVVRQCRLLKRCEGWTEESARLFACWCVRHTPLANGGTTWDLLNDKRSRTAVEVAEEYAKGKTTEEDLDAAWAAAGAAAGDAAWDAAGDAARDAARDAAWDAAGDAAWDAQYEELLSVINRKEEEKR